MKQNVDFDTLVDAYFAHAELGHKAPGLADYHPPWSASPSLVSLSDRATRGNAFPGRCGER